MGLFFGGLEANGLIYAYAFNPDGSYVRLATIVSGFGAVKDLQFDRDRGDLWAVCDTTCQGRSELLTINQTTGASASPTCTSDPRACPTSTTRISRRRPNSNA